MEVAADWISNVSNLWIFRKPVSTLSSPQRNHQHYAAVALRPANPGSAGYGFVTIHP